MKCSSNGLSLDYYFNGWISEGAVIIYYYTYRLGYFYEIDTF